MKSDVIYFDNTFHDVALKHRGTPYPDPPLLMWKDLYDDNKRPLPPARHRHGDFFALYIVEHGCGTHVIEGVSYAVSRGDVYVMGQETTHYWMRCHDLIVQGLYFSPMLFDGPTKDALAEIPGVPSLIPGLWGDDKGGSRAGRWLHLIPEAYEHVAGQIARLNGEWEARSAGNALMLRGLFTCLLIDLARFQAEAHPRHTVIKTTPHSAAVNTAIRDMEEGYADDLRIEQIAASVFLSRSRFAKIFQEAVGQMPSEYLRHIRIERAKTLLETTSLSITAIAGQTGFDEPAYFTRVFRAVIGMTPVQFRRRVKERSG